MTKLFFGILLVVSISTNSVFAQGAEDGNRYHQLISGVWELVNEVSDQSNDTFSWGKSSYSAGALLIDLKNPQPYVLANGQELLIDDVQMISDGQVQLKWHDLEFNKPHPVPSKEVHHGVLVINLVSKNKMWLDWKSSILSGFFAVGSNSPYYRTGGPELPQTIK